MINLTEQNGCENDYEKGQRKRIQESNISDTIVSAALENLVKLLLCLLSIFIRTLPVPPFLVPWFSILVNSFLEELKKSEYIEHALQIRNISALIVE